MPCSEQTETEENVVRAIDWKSKHTDNLK